MRSHEKFYGSVKASFYFFIWTIVFGVVAITVTTLIFIGVINFPFVAIKWAAIGLLWALSLGFMVPGFYHLRGNHRKKVICKYGELCFGGNNIKVYRSVIKQDTIYTMFSAYNLNFDIAEDYEHIRQYVKGQNAQRIVNSDILPLRSYEGEVVFDEKTFEKLSDGDLRLVQVLYKYRSALAKYKPLAEARLKEMREVSSKDPVKFNPNDEKFVNSLYNRLKDDIRTKFSEEETNRVWDLVDDEAHDYSNSTRLQVLGGYILYVKSNKTLLKGALEPIISAAKQSDALAYKLLASIFDSRYGLEHVPHDHHIAKYLFAVAYILGAVKEDDFKALADRFLGPSNKYDVDLIVLAAYGVRAMNRNFDEKSMCDYELCLAMPENEQKLVRHFSDDKSIVDRRIREGEGTDFDKFKSIHYEYGLKMVLYHDINKGFESLNTTQVLNDINALIS